MQTVTLTQLQAAVVRRADVVSQSSGRHDPSDVTAAINDAIGRYHIERTSYDPSAYTVRAVVTTSSSSSLDGGWEERERLPLPADVLSLMQVSHLRGDIREPLERMARTDDWLRTPGRPARYALAADTSGDAVLRLSPPADGAYDIELLYVRSPALLSTGSDEYTVVPGTLDGIVCDAALTLLETDGVPEPQQYAALTERRDRALGVLRASARRADRGAGSSMRDTRGRIGWTRRERW